MRTLEQLIAHLKKYKDAIIILGPGINKIELNYTPEDFNKNYTRKNLKRDPETLWKYYKDHIFMEDNKSNVYNLAKKIDHSLIVDQNYNGKYADIYLHGNQHLYKCQKCKTLYDDKGVFIDNDTTCEVCGKQLRPTVLLSGETYDANDFEKLKTAFFNTHTVITIGLDYNEEAITNLLIDYGNMKALESDQENNEKLLVAIQEKDFDFDPLEITFFEYIVKDDIEEALKRLLAKY